MHTFTALFDKRTDAEAVQARLAQLGIIDIDHNVYDQGSVGPTAGDTAGKTGLWGSAKGVAPPDEDRHIYEEALRRGGFLLTVNVDDQEADQVHRILDDSDAVDFDEREREMKQAGFAPPAPISSSKLGEQSIPIVEEQLRVGKRQVDMGGVRVRAYTVSTPVSEQVSLREEHVDVERRTVNARVDSPEALFEERVIEVTETGEEVVVGKQARVVEELTLRKDVGQRTETVSDTVRHTEVEVERTDGTVLPKQPPSPR